MCSEHKSHLSPLPDKRLPLLVPGPISPTPSLCLTSNERVQMRKKREPAYCSCAILERFRKSYRASVVVQVYRTRIQEA